MSKLFAKINVLNIIKDHLDTLINYNSLKRSKSDAILFFAVPLILSITLVFFKITINKDFIGVLINIFAIFAGLLFNLLVLVYDVISKVVKSSNNAKSTKLRLSLLKEIYSNISFEILLALFSTIILSISILFTNSILINISSFLVFFLVALFTLTLLMVLKRVHKLLSDEIDEHSNSI
ncbi:hypothetical protein ACSQ6I_07235 [Anabaena sp. WFMT]|uniref:hypothetical protein n=1 Tax=Anabaena sp. WFMT TaxID=3449730 RepID=UPI003F23B26A